MPDDAADRGPRKWQPCHYRPESPANRCHPLSMTHAAVPHSNAVFDPHPPSRATLRSERSQVRLLPGAWLECLCWLGIRGFVGETEKVRPFAPSRESPVGDVSSSHECFTAISQLTRTWVIKTVDANLWRGSF